MTRAIGICVIGLLAGCGGGVAVGPPRGANMPAGAVWAAGDPGPPPAYIEFGRPGRWMQYGSYCWQGTGVTACGDTGSPETIPDIPTLVVTRGLVGRIHLGFEPTGAQLTIGGRAVRFVKGRTIAFTARRAGLVAINLAPDQGDVAYYARIAYSA